MKIVHTSNKNKTPFYALVDGDVFDYEGNHMMKIKNNIEGRSFNAVRLVDGTLYGINDDAFVTPLPNAKLVIE